MVNIITNSFDKCFPPICPDDVSVEVTDYSCSASDILTITFIVHDIYNRNLSSIELLWSCDNDSFSNITIPSAYGETYKANINILGCSGLIYFKAKIIVKGTFVESDKKTFSVSLCEEMENNALRAVWCGNIVGIETVPDYDLYVRETRIPFVPIYFKYMDKCFHIDSRYPKIPITDDLDILISSIGVKYNNCEFCSESIIPVPGPSSSTSSGAKWKYRSNL